MASFSSVLWILGFILSVVIAPQQRMWTWGPTMLCFAAATLFTLPVLFRKGLGREALYVLIPGVATVAWIVVRGFTSPVAELAAKDLLLVAMAVSTFIVFRAAGGGAVSGKLLVGGIALILGASLWVIAKQIADPSFSPAFSADDKLFVRGFFGHYSYCASFLIPTSLLLAGVALHGRLHAASRVILLALAIAGLVAVVYTKSRGGVIGAGLGLAALALGSVLIGKRDGKRWFVPLALLAPLVLIGGGILFLGVLEGVQGSRSNGGDLTEMLDNTIRFYMLGMAMTCISWHPWLGGGSRSYSWESFRAWDVTAYGEGGAKPEHVHNELVQTVSEYGIVGGLLLLVFLGGVVLAAFVRILFKDRQSAPGLSDGWRIGGLAGLVGLFTQSNFEGILRIPPGAILLGLCLAAASATMTRQPGNNGRNISSGHWPLAVCALAAALPLLAFGWKGTKATFALWPAYFSRIPLGTETKIDALTEGIAAWAMYPLHQRRGILYRELAYDEDTTAKARREILEFALADFKRAMELHPLDPESLLNAAGTLIMLGKDTEAEPLYREATKAQGNMEAAFHANHFFAKLLLRKGADEYNRDELSSAITTLRLAAQHVDKAFELGRGYSLGAEGHFLRVGIRSALGQALEAAGDHRGALGQYDQVSALPHGSGGHYLAGRMLGKRAVVAWGERRSEDALRLFIDAEARVVKANLLPQGVTPAKRDEYLAYLRKTITFLRGAKVEPSGKPDF